jgi:methionine synthase II (cobalamin-independent)
VLLGVVPATDPASEVPAGAVTERVLRFLDMLGLDPGTAASLVLTPSCGLAAAGDRWARTALATCSAAAAGLRD